MVKCIAVLLLVALASQVALAAPKKNKDVPPTPNAGADDELNDLTSKVSVAVADVAETIKKHIPDAKDVTQAITTGTDNILHGLNNALARMESELEKRTAQDNVVLQEAIGKIKETITAIKDLTGPEAHLKAKEILTQLEEKFKAVGVELEIIGQNIKENVEKLGEGITRIAKALFNDFVDSVKTLNEQFADHPKTEN